MLGTAGSFFLEEFNGWWAWFLMTGCSGSGAEIRGKVYWRFEAIHSSGLCQTVRESISLLKGCSLSLGIVVVSCLTKICDV